MSDLVDYSGLYQILADLVARKRTSTLLGKTDTNRSVMIGVRDGEIVSLICAGRRGRSAISEVRKIAALSFRLDDNAALVRGTDLPPTPEIMHALRPAADTQDSGPLPAPTGVPDRDGNGQRLCELLSRFLGPIAPVMCSETIRAAGGLGDEVQRRQVILTLAKEIDDEAEAAQFIESARKMLGVS
jgi:hypothetical protein